MANIIKSKFMFLSLKYFNCIASRIFVPLKYQRLCIHTSKILDVKGKELLMPSLSPTMETGTIVKWFKKEGDGINPGDAIADIQTDKAIVTMEFDDEAILAKIIIPEGTKDIKVGTLIALTVEADEDWKTVEMPDKPVESLSKKAEAVSTESSPAVTKIEAPPPGQQNIPMPALSPTMTTGTIVKWHKQEGDEIQPGDALADIQTDKAIMTFELEEEGVLAKILVPEGSEVKIGQLIAITVEKEMDWKQIVIPKPDAPMAPSSAQPTAPIDAKPSNEQVYGLAVKRLLEEYGLNSDSIKGTGRTNRLLKSDVLTYIQTHNVKKVTPKSVAIPKTDKTHPPRPTETPVSSGQPSLYKDIEISNERALFIKQFMESNKIPQSYAAIDITMDKLNELCENLKTEDINLSINDFVCKAVALALLECPDVNSLYENEQIVRVQKVNISIIVLTPTTNINAPVIFDTATKDLVNISKNIKELIEKGKNGQLEPHELQGGTFTISNLGSYGITEFTGFVNPPQIAFLAVGSTREELDSSLKKITKMTIKLSYDRRAIDEDQAANFLAIVRGMLEDPVFLVAGKTQTLRYKRDAY